MSCRGDREFLLDILEACNRIIDFTKDMSYDEFVEDIKTQDAVLRNIEIIGEAVKNISDELKNRLGVNYGKLPSMQWRTLLQPEGLLGESVCLYSHKPLKRVLHAQNARMKFWQSSNIG